MGRTLRWGDFELDEAARAFRRRGEVVDVQPLTFEALRFLASRLDEAVSRQELLDAVWPGVRVVDDAVTQVIRRARAALGDDPRQPRFLLTVPRFGYRMVGLPTSGDVPETSPKTSLGTETSSRRTSAGFVGRERELADLLARLERPGIVSLTGLGGVGKTRLATEASALAREPSSRWWVDASGSTTGAELDAAVARAMGVRVDRAEIGHALGAVPRPLLVLDNLEQVAGPASEAVEAWTAAAPDLTLLATSRIPLHARGEEVVALAPLPPEDGIALFRERAASEAADDPAIAELVARLDGLPLAIELLAARTRSMSPTDLVGRLEHRLRVRAHPSERRPARHDSLAAMLDASWSLMTAPERATLAQLSVFAGGFSLSAAEAVVRADAWLPDTLQALVEHGLVVADVRASRYRLLETIRAYASERLAELEAVEAEARRGADAETSRSEVEARHGGWYARLGRWEGVPKGRADRQRECVLELPNLVAAAERAIARGDAAVAADCALATTDAYEVQGFERDGADRMARVRALPGVPRLRELLIAEAGLRRLADDNDGVVPLLEEAARMAASAGDARGLAVVLGHYANLRMAVGRHDEAAIALSAARAGHAAAGDAAGEGIAVYNLGRLADIAGRAEEAEALLREAIARLDDAGVDRVAARAQSTLARIVARRGARVEATSLFERALARHAELGDRVAEGETLGGLAIHLFHHGEIERAQAVFERQIELWSRLGQRRWAAVALDNRAAARHALGDLSGAAADFEAAQALHRAVGNRRGEAISLALLASLALDMGDPDRAGKLNEEARGRCLAIGLQRWAAVAALGLAQVAVARREADAALRWLDEAEPALAAAGETSALVAVAALRSMALRIHGDTGEADRWLAQARERAAAFGGGEDAPHVAILRKAEAAARG